jgi:predicted amidohydrolase
MLGVVQCDASSHDKASNVKLLERSASAASISGVTLLCFAELFLTSYSVDDELFAKAEGLDGPSVRAIKKIAKQYRVGLIFGMPETCEGQLFNTAVAIDRNGQLAGYYRKIHLFGRDEERIFTRGTDVSIVDMSGLRVGLAICYDIEFPEMGRALRRAGAQVICVPTANMHPFVSVPTTLVRARALENGIPIVYSNYCGENAAFSFTGGSAMVAYDGIDGARAGPAGQAMLTCALEKLLPKQSQDELLSTQLRDLRLS